MSHRTVDNSNKVDPTGGGNKGILTVLAAS